MDSSARMRQRGDKLREQLDSLKKEVSVANVLLQQILDKGVAYVEQIEAAKSPQIYLREYTKVQKFLLKYVHLITEINCNLEINSDEDDIEIQVDDYNAPAEHVRQGSEEREREVDGSKKIDPKTEFKEKVKKLVTEENEKEVKAQKVFNPKSWMEAPPFVPKVTTELKSNGTIVPKMPFFVPSSPQIRPVSIAPPPPPVSMAPPPPPVSMAPPPNTMNPFQFQVFYNMPGPPPPGMGGPVTLQMQGVPLWKTQVPHQQVPTVTRRPVKIESPMAATQKVSIKEIVETEVEKQAPIEERKVENVEKIEKKVENVASLRPEVPKLEPKKEEVRKPEVKKEEIREPEVIKVEVKKPEVMKEEVKKPEVMKEEVKTPEAKEEPKKPEVMGDEIPEMDISREAGKKYQVVFDHLVSPGEFYIQILCPALSGMREMCKEIETHFKNVKIQEQPYQAKSLKNKAKKELARRIVGRFGFCFTVDDPSWGRVEVKDWKSNEDNDSINVFFVDYGDTKTVSLYNLQPISPRFKKYPKFAQRCHLTDIYPPEAESGKPMPPWSTPSITMFEILLETMPNDFSCHIIVGESDGCYEENSLPVNFFVNDGGVSTSVNSRMVEFEAAKLLDEPPLPPDPNYSEENSKTVVGALDVATSQNLQVGEVLSIQVTCLLKLNRFYCVKECGDAEEDFLSKLIRFMNKPENVNQMLPLNEAPSVGQLVVGKYREDDLWYRARITKADPVSDRYKLLFLDYGNTEILPLKDIRKMEKKFLGFPFQLIECFIHGIEPSEETNSEEAMKYFYGRVEAGGLSIKICEVISDKNNCYEVELYSEQGEDIGNDLVISKFAVTKKT